MDEHAGTLDEQCVVCYHTMAPGRKSVRARYPNHHRFPTKRLLPKLPPSPRLLRWERVSPRTLHILDPTPTYLCLVSLPCRCLTRHGLCVLSRRPSIIGRHFGQPAGWQKRRGRTSFEFPPPPLLPNGPPIASIFASPLGSSRRDAPLYGSLSSQAYARSVVHASITTAVSSRAAIHSGT